MLQHLLCGTLCLKQKLKVIRFVDKININYNEKVLEDKKIFDSFTKELNKLYPNQVTFNLSKNNSFDLYFNDKLIYSLEDSFDDNLLIDNVILEKSKKYIENAINLSNSRDIPRVDDIGIVDY